VKRAAWALRGQNFRTQYKTEHREDFGVLVSKFAHRNFVRSANSTSAIPDGTGNNMCSVAWSCVFMNPLMIRDSAHQDATRSTPVGPDGSVVKVL
jgi:hypothetical protein